MPTAHLCLQLLPEAEGSRSQPRALAGGTSVSPKEGSSFLCSILKSINSSEAAREGKRAKNTCLKPRGMQEVQMVRAKGRAVLHRLRLLLPASSFIPVPRLQWNFLRATLQLQREQLGLGTQQLKPACCWGLTAAGDIHPSLCCSFPTATLLLTLWLQIFVLMHSK